MKYAEAIAKLKKEGYSVKEKNGCAEVEKTNGEGQGFTRAVIKDLKGEASIVSFDTALSNKNRGIVWAGVLIGLGIFSAAWWLHWKGKKREQFEKLIGAKMPSKDMLDAVSDYYSN